jgi:signal transduction histidine kinase
MAEPSPLAHSWQAVRDLPGRTPLRTKLVAAVLALTAVALAVISIAGISVLKNYLLNPYDNTLQNNYLRQAQNSVGQYLEGANPNNSYLAYVIWVPSGGGQPVTVLQQVQGGFHPGAGFSPTGRALPAPQIPDNPAWLAANNDRELTVPAVSGGGRWRVLVEFEAFPNANGSSTTGTIVVAVNVTSVYSAIGRLTGLDVIVSALLLLVILIVGIAVVRASLRPLIDIEKTAGAIAAGDLTRRVPDRDPRTEVGRLGRSLNAMLAQIETAFDARAESEFSARTSEERMRRFVADASHELRTPLTAIRGFAEYYRQRGGVAEIPGAPDRPALGRGDPTAREAETAGHGAGPGEYGAGPGAHEAGPGAHETGAGAHEAGSGAHEAGSAEYGGGTADYAAEAGHGGGPAGYGEGTANHGEGTAGYGEGTAGYGEGTAGYGELAANHGEGTADYGAAPAPRHGSNAEPIRTGPLTSSDLDRIMQRVEQESSRMGVLVEDMLLLARLDQQRPLEHRPVDMLTLAADAVHDARVVAPDRSINLTVGAGAALLVLGDEVRLRQVIGNLMSNALNHTPDGTPIEVRVRSGNVDEWRTAAVAAGARPASAGTDVQSAPAVVLEVADQGAGLTSAQAQHVFERFYRGDQARTRPGGTGLGLAIVASLVAAHEGRVWVESTPGRGATFRIAIPLAPEARHLGPDPEDSTNPDILDSRRTLSPRLADPPAPPEPRHDPPEARHERPADPALPKRRPGFSGHAHR